MQRASRRQCSAHRKDLQPARKLRAVRTSQGKAHRWMRNTNLTRSQQIVAHAQAQGVGVIRLEHLAGIRPRTRQRTARARRGGANRRTAANARTNTRLMATWTVHQLASFSADKAARAGIAVEWVDSAQTSKPCPGVRAAQHGR
jgi:transposase